MVKILAPGFYAKQDIRTPVKIAIVVLITTQLLNLILVPWLAHAGLALAIGLGGCLNATALLIGLRRLGIYTPSKGWFKFLARLVLALVIMAIPLALAALHLDWISLQSTPFLRVGWLGLVLSGSLALYLATLVLLGLRLRDFRRVPQANIVGKTAG